MAGSVRGPSHFPCRSNEQEERETVPQGLLPKAAPIWKAEHFEPVSFVSENKRFMPTSSLPQIGGLEFGGFDVAGHLPSPFGFKKN